MAGRLHLIAADLARAAGGTTPEGTLWIVVHFASLYVCMGVCRCGCVDLNVGVCGSEGCKVKVFEQCEPVGR